MSRQTLLLIKPNAFRNRHVGHIISILEEAGFNLLRIKEIRFTPESAAVFYDIHRGKEFFDRLVEFMCSAPSVALLLEKENAVEELRELIGDADPEKRRPGTIRDLYAEGVTENAVHASDSEASAERETRLIFG